MKVVILAGGFGTRLSEETSVKPKPMTEIGTHPVLWHIMKIYSHFGFNDFVILLGYKGYTIKEYFANYFLHNSDVTIDLASNQMEVHNNQSEPWKVTLLETGLNTMTGARIKRAAKYLSNETFLLTYGDGVANLDIPELIKFHRQYGKKMTITAVQPEGRFGLVDLDDEHQVKRFYEKPQGDGGWINAGFFVCEPSVLDYIPDEDGCVFERGPLEKLAADNQLSAYMHKGFWKCMDTLRDKMQLNEYWNTNQAKWKIWE
jgi:glucose-1-phosphate cytidylyltransferase